MAKLYFKVGSDWEEVVRLRNEIAKLKQELMSMDGTQSPAAFKALNVQLAVSNQRLDELVTNAAKAGAEMEGDFKKKIFDASQVVNGLSEEITLQRGTIQQLKNELSSLKDKYREALKQDGDTSSLEAKIKSTSEKLREQKSVLFNKLFKHYKGALQGKKIAVWGLAFKPETDDMRVATSLVTIDRLLREGCKVRVYDPVAMEECRRRMGGGVEYAADMYDTVLEVDALLIQTEWKQFRLPNWSLLLKLMNNPVIIDGRNIYDAEELQHLGFDYYCIGR